MRKKSELRPYQQRAITWCYETLAGILVATMGSGKTAIALTAVSELIEQKEIRHCIVVAPKRVAEMTWPKEIAGWEHLNGKLILAVCTGTPAKRLKILKDWKSRHVTVIGVDNLPWLVSELLKMEEGAGIFDMLVLDETSRFRNPKSKRAKELLRVRRRFGTVIGLTGTPRPSSELDFYMQAAVVTARTLWPKGFYAWRAERFYATDWNQWNWAIQPYWKEQTDREFASICLSIDDADMPELPALNFIWDDIVLPPAARRYYDQMERHLLIEVDGREIEAANAGVAVGKLTQIAAGYVYADGKDDVETLHDAKLEWLTTLIEDLQGEPLLVVYEHLADLDLIRQAAGGPIPVLGSGVSDKDAHAYIEAWNRGLLPVLAIHPASAGHGLNLQDGGRRQAWLSPCWSPEFWDQTIARLHRSGQTRPVFIHVAMAGNTIDEAKRMRVFHKLSAQEALKRYLVKA